MFDQYHIATTFKSWLHWFCDKNQCWPNMTKLKGEQGAVSLGDNTVVKQTNLLCFYRQKLSSPFGIGQLRWLRPFGLAK